MTLNPAKWLLKQGKTALLICDIQSNVSKVTFEFDKIVANTAKLINACKLLNIPVIVTEQNPTVLGSTVSELDISGAKGPFAKTQFNMCIPEMKETLLKICSGGPPETVLLAGLEAHACVEMTAMDLRSNGFNVHIVIDCISSCNPEDRFYALDRMKEIGCVLTTLENVIVKLIGGPDHPQFKTILKLLRPLSGQMGMSSSSKL